MKKIGLRFNAGVEYQGKIYASTVGINGLFELDLATESITYVKRFTAEKPSYAIHRCAFLYGDEAWFIPQNGRYIAVVNLDSMEIEYLDPPYRKINKDSVDRVNALYYSGKILGGRYLYLVPANVDALLLIDMQTKEIYPYYDVSLTGDYHLYGEYENGCVYLFPINGEKILEVNLWTDSRRYLSPKYDISKYGEVAAYGGRYWFCPYVADHILAWEMQWGELQYISLGEYYCEDCTYDQLYVHEGKLFLIPLMADRILVMDMETEELSMLPLEEEVLREGRNGFTRIFSEENILLASYEKNVLLIYDGQRGSFRSIKLCVSMEDMAEALARGKREEGWEPENFLKEAFYFLSGDYQEEDLELEVYARFFPIKKDEDGLTGEKKATVGMKILERMKES